MPSYITEITSLDLTGYGQAKLCAYPPLSIQYGIKAIDVAKRNNLTLKDPFTFMTKTCLTYCKKNDIQPNYAFVLRLIKQNNIDQTQPLLNKGKSRMFSDDMKPLQQRLWENPNKPPTADDFNSDKLTAFYKSKAWEEFGDQNLRTALHRFLMRSMNDAEHRE